MRIRTRLLLLFTFAFLCLGIAQAEEPGVKYQISDWKWAKGDEVSRAKPDFDDSSWETLKLPTSVIAGKPQDVFWMRSAFTVPNEAPEGLWFIVDQGGVAMELYVNGIYLGGKGRLPPDFDLRTTQYASIFLPSNLVERGKTIQIALRCAYSGTKISLVPYSIGNEEASSYYQSTGNMWNSRMYQILTALCVFLGLYFLLQFFFKTSEKENLYFAITLLALSLYLLDLGAEFWIFPYSISRAFCRAGLIVSMMFILPFFMAFLGNKKVKPALIASVSVSAVFIALFLLASGDENNVSLVFSLSCLAIFVPIGIGAVVSIRAIRSGVTEAWPILISIAIGIALAVRDASFQIAGTFPFVWLQGLGFFGLDLAIFIALSMRQAKLKTALVAYASEVDAKKTELASSLQRLGEAGKAAAELSARVEGAASSAAKAAEESANRSGKIGLETERQATQASEADSLVSALVESIEKVNESLATQNLSAERTATAATELSSGAESVAKSIEYTASFTDGLARLTGDGEKAAFALAKAIEKVSAASTGITEVVEAMNEFSERTNLLAMNAAIEAAHSGQAGKGFAIIASEVKKLASFQSERASRINEIVADIVARVGEGSTEAERLKSTLKEIATGSAEAAQRLSEVRRGTDEQKRASGEISLSMEALAVAIAAIQDEAKLQEEYSGKVRASVAEIASAALEVNSSAKSIIEDGTSLALTVRSLRDMAAKGGELTQALSGIKNSAD